MFRSAVVAALMALGFFTPALAEAADELSTSDRLDDRRFVTAGPARLRGRHRGRAATPPTGFHTRGEMGGVWTPPIKLLDGIWFGVGEPGSARRTRYTSGWGYVRMDLPAAGGADASSAPTSCPTARAACWSA